MACFHKNIENQNRTIITIPEDIQSLLKEMEEAETETEPAPTPDTPEPTPPE